MSNASPNDTAKTGSSSDAMSAVGECPLKKTKMQLVPVRYGLVEKERPHLAINSRHKRDVKFRPIGVRPLPVDGYLYVIHSNRKDIIYVYSVKTDGSVQKLEQQALSDGGIEYIYSESEKALVVERCGSIDILYSRTPISAKLQNQLLDSAKLREQLMQTCPIGQFKAGKGSKHLLPPEQLGNHLADSQPTESDNLEEFRWCWESEAVDVVSADTITAHILPKYQEDAAVVILEDPIGIKTELASAYLGITNMEHSWFEQDNHRAKYFAAEQIKLLMEIGERQFKANSDNKAITACIDSHLEALKQRYLDYTEAYDNYWELVKKQTNGPDNTIMLRMDTLYDSDELKHYQTEQIKNSEFAQQYSIDPTALDQFFTRVRQENKALLDGKWAGLTGDRGILDRIDDDAMEHWYFDAQRKLALWREQTDIVNTDRGEMLEAAYAALPVFDKENKETLLARLQLENHWLINIDDVAALNSKVRDFWFADIGEQNLHTFISNQDSIATLAKHDVDAKELADDFVKLRGIKGDYNDTVGGLAGLVEFQNLLAGRHLIAMEAIPDEIRAQLNRLGSQLSGLAIDELNTLTDSLKAAQTKGNALVYHARPGLVALLLGQKKNANVTLEMGVEAGNALFNEKFTQLEQIRFDAEKVLSQRNSVEAQTTGTRVQKEALRAEYNKQLKTLAEQAEETLMDLSARSEPIAVDGQPHPPSHITVKAAGAGADELDEILKLRRKVLTNELLWGKAKGVGRNGSVGSGSMALVVFAINAWNWSATVDKFDRKSKLTGVEKFEYFAGITGFLSSATSVTVEVLKAKASYDWINRSTEVSKAILGKVVTLGTFGVSLLTTISSVADSRKQMNRISGSWQKGDIGAFVASSSALAGDGVQAWHAGKLAFYSGKEALSVISGRITWQIAAENTLGLVARANPYMLVASVLIFAGEFGYNFLQSTPLMRWVSQCVWGKDGIWFWYDNQHWDYATQMTKWLEVTQTPQVNIETEQYGEAYSSPSGNWSSTITKHRIKTLQLVIPLVNPQQVRIAGSVKVAGQKRSVNITKDNLIAQSRVTYDGLNTVYEFDWPQDKVRQKSFLYLDLLIEVTAMQGDILFAEQQGARFTVNLQEPENLDKLASRPNWYKVTQLEQDDAQYTPSLDLVANLALLKK
jgi:hypothetical protein